MGGSSAARQSVPAPVCTLSTWVRHRTEPVVGDPLLAFVHVAAAVQRADVELAQISAVDLVVVPEDGLALLGRHHQPWPAVQRLLELGPGVRLAPGRQRLVRDICQREHGAACARGWWSGRTWRTPPSGTSCRKYSTVAKRHRRQRIDTSTLLESGPAARVSGISARAAAHAQSGPSRPRAGRRSTGPAPAPRGRRTTTRAANRRLGVRVALVVAVLAVLDHLQLLGKGVLGELGQQARAADERLQLVVGDPRLVAVPARASVRQAVTERLRTGTACRHRQATAP